MKNKRNNIVEYGMLLFVFVMCFSCMLSAEENPSIAFSEQSWDFGTIKQGDKATHVFIVMNEGTGILQITKVRSSCGCTAAILSKRELENGEKSEIKATFNSSGRSGPFKKTIFVHSNDPQAPMRKLVLKGNIQTGESETPIKFIPVSWNIGLVKEKKIFKKQVTLLNTGYKDVIISAFKTSEHMQGKMSLPQVLSPGKVSRIDLELTVPGKRGKIQEKVMFYTDIPGNPTLTYYVRGFSPPRQIPPAMPKNESGEIKK